MPLSPTGQRKQDRALEEGKPEDRPSRQRERQTRDDGSKAKEWDIEDRFDNYQPPRRLLALEFVVIILLVILLLFNPNGFTAISMKGTDTVGLLSSCTGGTCTSWLGAPAGGSTGGGASTTTAASTPAPEKRAPTDSTSTSSPTTFHLQTGLAAFCTFILLLYAFAFHLFRLRSPPSREGPDLKLDEKFDRSRLRRKCFKRLDASGIKRFGYRVSRLYTGVNVLLLLCVCISAGVQASSAGFGSGFFLLVVAWILLFLVALIEFLNDGRKIRTLLMFKEGWGRRKPTEETLVNITETTRDPSRGRKNQRISR